MQAHRGRKVETVYIGGGTPSVLKDRDLRGLFDTLGRLLKIEARAETSMECNPESVTPGRLRVLKECGVNRLSFGLQSADDRGLRMLGRIHSYGDFTAAYRQARKNGFDNISIDLMYGIPGQGLEEWKGSLRKALRWRPEHVSVYALTVEAGTEFSRRAVSVDGDLQADMYEWACDYLDGKGYRHYEISNFAFPGHECRHNMKYWRREPVFAVGLSAASFDGKSRVRNSSRLDEYLRLIRETGSAVVERERLSGAESVGERLMLALRTSDGIVRTPALWKTHGELFERFVREGCLIIRGDRVRPTRKGWLLSNQLFQELV